MANHVMRFLCVLFVAVLSAGSLPADERENRPSTLQEVEHAITLDPNNPYLFYKLALAAYDVVAKHAEGLSVEAKRDVIGRGLAALERAQSPRFDFDPLTYRSLLLREQAKLESDSALRRKLIEEADAVRRNALDRVKARRDLTPLPETGPYRVGGAVMAPVVRHRIEPVLTDEARSKPIAGVVILEALIDHEGRVRDVKVVKGLPFGRDQAAVEAVRQWSFEPGTLIGEPVDVLFNLTVAFTFRGGKVGEP